MILSLSGLSYLDHHRYHSISCVELHKGVVWDYVKSLKIENNFRI